MTQRACPKCHLQSCGLTMATAYTCPLSPQDCRLSHSLFLLQKGSLEHSLCTLKASTEASSAADFYPIVKAALHHKMWT